MWRDYLPDIAKFSLYTFIASPYSYTYHANIFKYTFCIYHNIEVIVFATRKAKN